MKSFARNVETKVLNRQRLRNTDEDTTDIKQMNVLIACEESQTVCKAFRALGHRAFSADLQECSGGHPEWHVVGDCLPLLNGDCEFTTQDGRRHRQRGEWQLPENSRTLLEHQSKAMEDYRATLQERIKIDCANANKE